MHTIKRKFKNAAHVAFVSIMLVSVNSCATIAGDNTRSVSVSSTPPGASIYVDGQRYGTTPAVVTLPSYVYGGKTVTLKKEGYNDEVVNLNTKFQPCGLWNLLFLPGFLIDGATGSTVKIDPVSLHVNTGLQSIHTQNAQ